MWLLPGIFVSDGQKVTFLPEVVISDDITGARVICLITGELEYATSRDTMLLSSEAMADYLIPLKTRKGKFKERRSPRVLNKRNRAVYRHEGSPDSIAENIDDQLYSMLFMCDYPKVEFSDTAVNGSLRRGVDLLADKKDHRWSPTMFKLFGMTTDFTRLEFDYTFNENDEGKYSEFDLSEFSMDLEALVRGKLMKWVYDSKEPVSLSGSYRVKPVAIEYLTPKGCKEISKDDTSVSFPCEK